MTVSVGAVEGTAEVAAENDVVDDAEDARPPVRVLGIRHHGPGPARALAAALGAYRPDCVLIEGPAAADGLIEWAGRGLEPPVALLAWDNTDPSEASFWPMAVFSPEWQALSWAVAHGAKAHFMDLPAAAVLAERKAERERARAGTKAGTEEDVDDADDPGHSSDSGDSHASGEWRGRGARGGRGLDPPGPRRPGWTPGPR